jgi:hypothetical protein
MDSISAFLGAYREIYRDDDGLTPEKAPVKSDV